MREFSSSFESKSIMAKVPCTCGELFQGTLEGQPCLVSCPINIYSTAQTSASLPDPSITGQKVNLALEYLARHTGKTVNVEVADPLPVGRGFGTSTADIGAALFAASRISGLTLTSSEASQIAVKIEPTDSSLFPGLTLFDHRTGKFQMTLGSAPPAQLLILDPGGEVDSQAFNTHEWQKELSKIADQQIEAFHILQQGIIDGNLLAIGEASTMSAKSHQVILDNPLVDVAISLAAELNAVGVCRAHSGTIVGLILPLNRDCGEILRFLACKLPVSIHIRRALLINGGPIYDTESVSIEAQQNAS